jgi:hypothetical protein
VDVAAVRAGLAAKLANLAVVVDGQSTPVNVYQRAPGDVATPAVVVRPAPGTFVQYVRTQSQTTEALFLVSIVVSGGWSEQAQAALDDLISTDAVLAAFTGSVTGVTDYAVVVEAQNYGDIEVAGVPQFGVDFLVEVSGL